MKYARWCLIGAGALAVLLSYCSGGSVSRREITETRQADSHDLAPPRLSTAERFGTGANPHAAMGGMTGMDAMAGASAMSFAWDTPEGWEELPPTQMRQANFRIAGDPATECYLSVLGGEGGGLLANINRWRGQMSFEPMDEAALAALPRKTLLGKEAAYVSMRGTYQGMQGDRNEADYMMLALAAVQGGQSYFVRLTGPASVVEQETARFEAFCESLREAQAGQAAEAPANGAQGLQWDTPAGWEQAPARPMRLVTYTAHDGVCECRAFMLSGTAGGVDANINRWRDQMNQPPLSAEELAALPRWPILGREAVYVEIQGDYTGMSGATLPGQLFLGLVAPYKESTLFVIMVGPEAQMAQEKDNFAAFCKSMRQSG
ncbi:MAG: hypothetical protein KA184_18240 [Candidatus Hydrogenedentes bacterium]|nr:hypothetical protein [Candidatus Hydrogenedentota bacterium]